MKKLLITLITILLMLGALWYAMQPKLINIDKEITPLKANTTTTIYAAYSADGSISDYVISYLRALKEVSPNIIYITDNPLRSDEIEKLSPWVNRIVAQRHGEYDWGSYKRGLEIIEKSGILKEIHQEKQPLLIFANDSTLLLAASLQPLFFEMEKKNVDFWGITANQDGTYHLQSYFLAFTPKVYTSNAFKTYLQAVKAEKDGLSVAYRYEVPFTQYLTEAGFSSASYIPYEELSYLPLNDKNCYPLTLMSKYNIPFLKMRTFTDRLNVQEPRRLVFNWLKTHHQRAYEELMMHLRKIKSPYLKEARE